jgi:hypothetical protein
VIDSDAIIAIKRTNQLLFVALRLSECAYVVTLK